ncbi:hypothetical protein [Sulfuricurvum sp.]|uniref:hypothetical protein n=2 Tax=Sulfuricurvum sp. TaxID=2025608 RepID=UPI0026132498|nr:hypothetical protein [Sulfuricurvum sp.]MDD3596726.1 hypothetical protein [Sulfuricurvum sp.]MDD4883364.1 hypothetical protein [Sulfuricurvum sp.]
MTYREYVTEMHIKFPHHQPMKEEDFNAMLRIGQEDKKIVSSVREGCKRLLEPTLESYTKIETDSKKSRKNPTRTFSALKSYKQQSA